MWLHNEVDTVKIEKEKAMQRYIRLKKIVTIFKALEFCFAVLFFSWLISRSSSCFTAVFHLSGVFLHRSSSLLLNHHFVFLLGNGIVITLFVKFGQFVCDKPIITDEIDDHENLIGQVVTPHETAACEIPPQEAVSKEKVIISTEIEADPVARRESEVRKCRRSRSHEFGREKTEEIQLQRSETEPRRKSESSGEESTSSMEKTFDNLSNEEFQLKVEAFIARQQKFLREESLATIVFSGN